MRSVWTFVAACALAATVAPAWAGDVDFKLARAFAYGVRPTPEAGALPATAVVRGQQLAQPAAYGPGPQGLWGGHAQPASYGYAGEAAQSAAAVGGCTSCATSDSCGCGACGGCGDCCCLPNWEFFGEFIFVRPSNASVAYATMFDGGGSIPLQMGRRGVLNSIYEPGFRIGASKAISDCSSIRTTYERLETEVRHSMPNPAPNTIRSLVIHPSSANAGTNWDAASGRLDIDYHLADIDFRRAFICDPCAHVNYLVGIRYANLKQEFRSTFTEVGVEQIDTDVNFDGGGIRLGLEGERRNDLGLLVYGKGVANFVAGEFSTRYWQGNESDPVIVNTRWKNARVVTILDLEAGVGWVSPNGCVRLTAGYMFSTWLNSVRSSDWIEAVQTNSDAPLQTSVHRNVTFDGFTARAEIRY